MKKIIPILITLFFITGYAHSEDFSITGGDKLDKYVNDSKFIKVKPSGEEVTYVFNAKPNAFFGVKVGDLEVLGGYVSFRNEKLCHATLSINKRSAFDTLLTRLKGSDLIKNTDKREGLFEKGTSYIFLSLEGDTRMVQVIYDRFVDNVMFAVLDANFCP
ncbi:hypothetical protein [Entomomonas asaccharolytica]|uniref:Uncharacterized protein n=1 Tax=Entomomonas asaccharolytica TaxID=2785331 RepID=A0A974RXB1_9GAMM|nr:hypothetical protein [Entomomonas asaccharolytica]QQP86043.1 hypothetical protein JHT90_01955 [Entomomonas asaccharolytica]